VIATSEFQKKISSCYTILVFIWRLKKRQILDTIQALLTNNTKNPFYLKKNYYFCSLKNVDLLIC